jgi:hypothetical protein
MAVLRTSDAAATYAEGSRVLDGVPNGVPTGTRSGRPNRNAIALLVYSTGYPLLASALWSGARNGDWVRASLLVALGVAMSFVGWALLCLTGDAKAGATTRERDRQPHGAGTYLALYNRAGAIVVLLASYAVAARSQGWPTPQTFIGWFVLVWIPLFVSFAIPVDRSSRSSNTNV